MDNPKQDVSPERVLELVEAIHSDADEGNLTSLNELENIAKVKKYVLSYWDGYDARYITLSTETVKRLRSHFLNKDQYDEAPRTAEYLDEFFVSNIENLKIFAVKGKI
jgi:hypothetical protein